MKTYYKLTDKDGYTRKGEINKTLWGENVRHDATGIGRNLCSEGLIHAYESPEMAVFMNPVFGNYDLKTMLMWECRLHGRVKRDGQLKCGAKGCTTLQRIPAPIITTEQRAEIAIRIALTVYDKPEFIKWATNWLSGTDRTAESAASAGSAAWNAKSVAGANSAASAAWSANNVVSAVWNANSVDSAESVAWSVESAAWSAASTASVLYGAPKDNITSIIRAVLKSK